MLERKKLWSVLSSSSSKGGFYKPEIMHDRKTAWRPKLFMQWYLQEQRPKTRKTVLGLSLRKYIFFTLETYDDRRT